VPGIQLVQDSWKSDSKTGMIVGVEQIGSVTERPPTSNVSSITANLFS